ncbi:hypothetical protein ACPPVO_32985 [Dactylosporangium sp. McL0621]|uniref:hypothetical protein n=1 Tax=Dactylosporangium sp. McL0621 TaxID=3415678 RepID=UPI003CECC1F5
MTNKSATCVALVLAAVGDAGPEIVASRSLFAGYDGPGPLIYLGVAVVVATVRWRFAPLLAVAMSALFLPAGSPARSSSAGSPARPPSASSRAGCRCSVSRPRSSSGRPPS